MIKLKIAEHVPYPGGRYINDGPYSGEWFRNSILRPLLDQAISNNDTLVVDLDDVPGYGISFLEEGFGGLIRYDNYDYQELSRHLKIVSSSHKYESYERISNNVLSNAEKIKQAGL